MLPPSDTIFSQAMAAFQAGKLNDAEQLFKKVLWQQPKHFAALNLLAIVLMQLEQHAEAEHYIKSALNVNEKNDATLSNYGIILKTLKRPLEALEHFSQALAVNSANSLTWNNRGTVLYDLKRYKDAVADFDKATLFDSNFSDAFCSKGNSLCQLKRYDEAFGAYDKALALKPDLADAWLGRGNVFNELKRHDEASAAYDKALALKPDLAEAWLGRGNIFFDLKRYDEAVAAYDKALTLEPDLAEAWRGRGNVFKELARFDEAVSSYEKAIALKPDFADAYCNRSICLLLMGRFEEGWRDHEFRKKMREAVANRIFPQPLWLGAEDIAGKTVLIHAEQGLGDTIQFCRYIKLLEEVGAKVLFAPQNSLQVLMRSLSSTIDVVGVDDLSLTFDYHCPLLSLPLAFKTILETVPSHVPYLCAEAERIERWKHKIGTNGFKIGICWQGGTSKVDAGRSFPIAEFLIISQIPNVRLISLHKGEGVSQLANLPNGMSVETLGDEFDAGSQAFLDTAAVMKNCDLIITSDTAVAHLAGALSLPTWVALKHVPDWRWTLDRSDTPWYPTMRLFRQTVRDDWKSVFVEIEKELRPIVESNV